MAKRRIGQSRDIVIGGLKRLLYNDNGNIPGSVRLEAAILMMKIDGFFPKESEDKQADSGPSSPEPLSAADAMLAGLRKVGGGNADS